MTTVFLVGTLRLLMVDINIPNNLLALFNIMNYPYTLRFLFAPIMDCKYSEKIGKRKTYIIPVLVLWIILSFVFGYLYDYSKEN